MVDNDAETNKGDSVGGWYEVLPYAQLDKEAQKKKDASAILCRLKRCWAWALILVVFISITLLSCASPELGYFQLKLAFAESPDAFAVAPLVECAKEIEKTTESHLEFTFYYNEELYKAADTLDAVEQGMVDIGGTFVSFDEENIPAVKVLSIPFLYDNAAHNYRIWRPESPAFKMLDSEYRKHNCKLLANGAGYTAGIAANKPVISSDDLKDMRIAVNGVGLYEFVKTFGGIPLTMPTEEIYTAAQKGEIDGVIEGINSVMRYRHYEFWQHFTKVDITFPDVYLIMNLDTWNRLPEKYQDLLANKMNEAHAKICLEVMPTSILTADSEFEAHGGQIHDVPLLEQGRWFEKASPISDKVLSETDNVGREIFQSLIKYRSFR